MDFSHLPASTSNLICTTYNGLVSDIWTYKDLQTTYTTKPSYTTNKHYTRTEFGNNIYMDTYYMRTAMSLGPLPLTLCTRQKDLPNNLGTGLQPANKLPYQTLHGTFNFLYLIMDGSMWAAWTVGTWTGCPGRNNCPNPPPTAEAGPLWDILYSS